MTTTRELYHSAYRFYRMKAQPQDKYGLFAVVFYKDLLDDIHTSNPTARIAARNSFAMKQNSDRFAVSYRELSNRRWLTTLRFMATGEMVGSQN